MSVERYKHFKEKLPLPESGIEKLSAEDLESVISCFEDIEKTWQERNEGEGPSAPRLRRFVTKQAITFNHLTNQSLTNIATCLNKVKRGEGNEGKALLSQMVSWQEHALDALELERVALIGQTVNYDPKYHDYWSEDEVQPGDEGIVIRAGFKKKNGEEPPLTKARVAPISKGKRKADSNELAVREMHEDTRQTFLDVISDAIAAIDNHAANPDITEYLVRLTIIVQINHLTFWKKFVEKSEALTKFKESYNENQIRYEELSSNHEDGDKKIAQNLATEAQALLRQACRELGLEIYGTIGQEVNWDQELHRPKNSYVNSRALTGTIVSPGLRQISTGAILLPATAEVLVREETNTTPWHEKQKINAENDKRRNEFLTHKTLQEFIVATEDNNSVNEQMIKDFIIKFRNLRSDHAASLQKILDQTDSKAMPHANKNSRQEKLSKLVANLRRKLSPNLK